MFSTILPQKETDMNEIARIVWFAANGLLILTAIGITVGNIVSDIRAAKEANELSGISSFMESP